MGLEDYSVDSNLLMEMLYRSSRDGKVFFMSRAFSKNHMKEGTLLIA